MKQRIAAAYMQLARSGDVDRITVTSLVEACGISRQTYYYHFQDILDVVQWCFQQAVEQTTLRCRQAETPQAAIRLFLNSAAENHPLILRLLASQHRAQMEALLIQSVRDTFVQLLRSGPPPSIPLADLDAALDFYAYAVGGMLLRCCGQPRLDRELLSEQLYRLLSGQLLLFPPSVSARPKASEA